MSFESILQDLVERVPGARGAVFVDGEGEYVELFPRGHEENLKLAGAHQGIVLDRFAEASRESGTGEPRVLFVRGEEMDLFARRVKDGYFVLLETEPNGVPGKALWQLSLAARRIEAEI